MLSVHEPQDANLLPEPLHVLFWRLPANDRRLGLADFMNPLHHFKLWRKRGTRHQTPCPFSIMVLVLIGSHGARVDAADLIRTAVLVVDDPIRSVFPNGRSFSQYALDSFGATQYATYWDAEDRLCVARRALPDGAWAIIRFEDYHIVGGDAHETTVLGICPIDGTVHLAFDHHDDPLHYRVSVPGLALDPASFSWQSDLFGPVTSRLTGTPIADVTYPRFITAPSGVLQLWFRIGSSGDGDIHVHQYDPNSGGWSHMGLLISGQGDYQGSPTRNAYLNGMHFGPSGALHVTFCWRETPQVETNHDLNYIWSPDEGVTWLQNEGMVLNQPIEITAPGLTVWPIPMNQGLLNACAQAVDPDGHIHAVMVDHNTGDYTHYWRDAQNQWHADPIPYAGARPKMVFDVFGDAYVICPGMAILSATAQTDWQDWQEVHDPWIMPESETVPPPEPVVDVTRWATSETLSVYHQRGSRLLVMEFQRAEGILIFRDGFETGDANAWSWHTADD